MRKHRAAALLVTVALSLPTLAACSDSDSNPASAPKTEREAVNAYVAALNSKDTAALQRLAPSGNDASAEATSLIKANGGRDLKITSVDIQHEFGPDTATADVAASAKDGKGYHDRITLGRSDGKWSVAIGQNPKGATKESSSTERP
ncbi:hypothetical protein [Streptomyces melanogenes]|uniref:hypothetical protein n=1 Tax=Streptomyces melanogenes TaxID=67326 RepID=UPI0037B548A9